MASAPGSLLSEPYGTLYREGGPWLVWRWWRYCHHPPPWEYRFECWEVELLQELGLIPSTEGLHEEPTASAPMRASAAALGDRRTGERPRAEGPFARLPEHGPPEPREDHRDGNPWVIGWVLWGFVAGVGFWTIIGLAAWWWIST